MTSINCSAKYTLLVLIILVQSALSGLDVYAQHSTAAFRGKENRDDVAERMQSTILADALLNLAENRQLELAYAPELLAGKSADCPALPEDDAEAIRCILAKSGLAVTQLDNGVFVIHKPSGEASVYKGSIKGMVRSYESGILLANAHVTIKDTPYSTISGKDGAFHIAHLTPGLYDVQVSMLGYEPRQFPQIHVIAGQSIEVDLKLVEATWPLDEVVITSKSNRKGINLPDTLDPLGYQGFRVGTVNAGLFMSAVPTTVKGLQLGGLGSMARDSLRGVQFGGVFNAAKSADGLQFGGVFNTVTGDLNGYQFSGVLNQLGGELKGGQFAGTVNVSGNMRGAQFGGVANLADGHARGIQAAGIVNVAGNMAGTQVAGLANRANEKHGFQGAGIMNMSGTMTGVQASGMLNIVDGDFKGLQASGMLNMGRDTRGGVQLSGMINVARNVDGGVQIGLLNIANNNTGLPLGVISYVRETGLRFDTWIDEMGLVSTAIRSGNRSFSNYIGVAAGADESLENEALLFGLGGEFTHSKRVYSTLDAMYYLFGVETSKFDEHMAKMRLMVGFKVLPRIAFFGGPSLNLFISDNPTSTVPVPSRRIDEGKLGSSEYKLWTGFAFGLRILSKP